MSYKVQRFIHNTEALDSRRNNKRITLTQLTTVAMLDIIGTV